MTDETGTIVWQASHDAFGKTTVTTETVANHLRFPGQYFDQETELHYNYFRTYDPNVGRYMTSDPIGLGGGISTYEYAYQNPINNFDPDGRLVWFGIPAYIWATGGGVGAIWIATNTPGNIGSSSNIDDKVEEYKQCKDEDDDNCDTPLN